MKIAKTTRAALLLALSSGGLVPLHDGAAVLVSSGGFRDVRVPMLLSGSPPPFAEGSGGFTPPFVEAQHAAPVVQNRIRLAPKLVPGRSLRYQIDTHTVTTSRSSGRIEDPQGPSKTEVNLSAIVRLEILASTPNAPQRFRLTYDKSTAAATSDSFDPSLAVMQEQYRKLEGRSLEFSLDAQGKAANFTGLEGMFPDKKSAAAAREWFSQLTSGVELPRDGIILGQSWSSTRTNVLGMPLLGLTWRTESTYLRDEPCASDAPDDICAVILTRLSVTQRPLRNATPDEYRRRNMRTSGKLASSGESLSYISLRTGWLVRVSQTSSEETDIVLMATDGGSQLRINARVESSTHIALLPAL